MAFPVAAIARKQEISHMEFVKYTSGSPPLVSKIGQVQYIMWRELSGPQKIIQLFPNGAALRKEHGQDKYIAVMADTPEDAWEMVKQSGKLIAEFGIDL